jgi:hypothetical protein
VRASYQDSNIFGYKDPQNSTWQEPGRVDRNRTELKTHYHLSNHSAGMTLSNPGSPMKHNQTEKQARHVLPSQEMYYHNKRSTPLERKGQEFYGTTQYEKERRKDL